MHYVEITFVLIVSHAAAAILGMIFKNKAMAALKKENDQLRSSASKAVKDGLR